MRIASSLMASAILVIRAAAQTPSLPPPPPAANGPSGAIQRRAAPPARIVKFTVEPTSIQPGQPVMLVWATENPNGQAIDPDLGRVTARGSRQLFPKVTTTYTLTVRGPNNTILTKSVTVNVAGTVEAKAASEPTKKDVPRTADGKPDLSGVYDFSRTAPGAANAASPPTLKPGAEKYKPVHGPNYAGLTADCRPLAGPQAFSVPYQFQIVQGAHSVAILLEYPGVFRIVPTDGGPHQVDLDPTWQGDSIGHWEGDTLVIDSLGFNDKTEIGGFLHSEALHIVERFRRAEYDTLQYEATIEDPNVFAAPWKVTRSFALRPDLVKIDEFVCENNPDYSNLFKK